MIMPSMIRCGSTCISMRSLKVPGSISSALHITYLGKGAFSERSSTFAPRENRRRRAPGAPHRAPAAALPGGKPFQHVGQCQVTAALTVFIQGGDAARFTILKEHLGDRLAHLCHPKELAYGSARRCPALQDKDPGALVAVPED